ncbi:hypothetical protein [Micromonospora sp. NPDC023956]|uniref:hypothetical protein n=1 Tax=Micromonospora sp. NPDC023956 TaxID=3155722 RepID=UPI00340D3D84
MNDTTTAGALDKGARVLVSLGVHGPMTFASDPDGARVAEVWTVEKVGRKRRVTTDLGPIEAGPTARVLVAPAQSDAPAPAEPPAPSPLPPTLAVVTVDPAGRLTAESLLTVVGESVPVPVRVERAGGSIAPVRLGHVLASLGLEQVTQWQGAGEGRMSAEVRPRPEN